MTGALRLQKGSRFTSSIHTQKLVTGVSSVTEVFQILGAANVTSEPSTFSQQSETPLVYLRWIVGKV